MSVDMYKIGVCGHFGEGHNLVNGQTIKTEILTDGLITALGANEIKTVDTYNWRKRLLSAIIQCFLLVKNSENIVVLPAHNGVKTLIPLFLLINKLFNRKLHYIVIGGWLPELLRKNLKLRKKISRLNGVYVETLVLKKELNSIGLENIFVLPNFKNLKIIDNKDIVYSDSKPIKVCTFSRVTDKKGIEDAIEVVSNINKKAGEIIYALDIFGPIDKSYEARFNEIIASLPNYIKYRGVIEYDNTVDTLKDYFALLFPTRYATEGIPGTIIDAYAAGIPVIASEWNSAREIVIENETGYVYEFNKNYALEEILINIAKHPKSIYEMKKKCLNKVKEYSSKSVIGSFIKEILE